MLTLVVFLTRHYASFSSRWLSDPIIEKAFYEADSTQLMPIVQLIWEELWQRRNDFVEFRHIEQLFKRILAKQKWSKAEDFRTNWREIDEKML